MRGKMYFALSLLVSTVLAATLTRADDDSLHLSVSLMEVTYKIQGPSAKERDPPGVLRNGTAFTLGRPWPTDATKSDRVLVTAAHVLDDIAGDTASLILRHRSSDHRVQPYTIKIRDNGEPKYKVHPKADVAVMYLSIPKWAAYPNGLLPYTLLLTEAEVQEIELIPGEELLTLGFPRGATSFPGAYPFLRTGRLASYPLTPISLVSLWMYDFTVIPGNSGGPVFLTAFGRRIGRKIKMSETNKIIGLVSNSASKDGVDLVLAGIVPSPLIRETIEILPPPSPKASP